MKRSANDLSQVSDDDLLVEWQRLLARPQTLGVRSDLVAVELELLRRSWNAPCAKDGQR